MIHTCISFMSCVDSDQSAVGFSNQFWKQTGIFELECVKYFIMSSVVDTSLVKESTTFAKGFDIRGTCSIKTLQGTYASRTIKHLMRIEAKTSFFMYFFSQAHTID